MHSYLQDLGWDYYMPFFAYLYQLWPLIYARISFPLSILRTNRQDFLQILIYDQGLDYYTSFLLMCIRVLALDL